MKRSIVLKDRVLEYELVRKGVKNINLRIKPDMSVTVSASNRVSIAEIESFIRLKEDTVIKALERLSRLSPQYEPQYVSGEIVSFVGVDHLLCVEQGSKNRAYFNNTENEHRIILIVTDTDDLELKRKTLEKLAKANLREIFILTVDEVYERFKKLGVEYPDVRIRTMKSRWGSCMPKKGVLTFNTYLIAAPLPCIEYVVAHEFTHFLHPDHSKSFYGCLEKVCPEWKSLKKELNGCRFIRKANDGML